MRPKKQNLDYFSHDRDMRNDPKIRALRTKYGLKGYALYNMLLEYLSDSDLLLIEINDLNYELMAGDFGVDPEEIRSEIEYCVNIGLFRREENLLWCPSLDDRSTPVFAKRTYDLVSLRREKYSKRWVSASETIQSKVKENNKEKDEYDLPEKFLEQCNDGKNSVVIKNIIEYLNQKTNKNYSTKSEKTKKFIKTRLNEGFNEEDFQKVIDNKCFHWLNDPKWEKYLRPETLFSTKFESYLNEKPKYKNVYGDVVL
jgi:uncharacterized phage protein (TIGR02220 family)